MIKIPPRIKTFNNSFNQKRSVLNRTVVSGGLGPIVEEAALTQSTVAVVAAGQGAVEMERADNLAVV